MHSGLGLCLINSNKTLNPRIGNLGRQDWTLLRASLSVAAHVGCQDQSGIKDERDSLIAS